MFIVAGNNDKIIPMKNRKDRNTISSPDDLNKRLQYTSVFTLMILSSFIVALSGLFTWSFLATVEDKILGKVVISSSEATLVVNDSDKSRLEVGQKIYVTNKVGEILSFNNEEPVISSFDLADGTYTCKIVIGEIRPIDFLIK